MLVLKKYFKHDLFFVFLKGLCMGAADVVPGVSGGTVAFITGIYQRLLNALNHLTPASLQLWWHEGWFPFWRKIDGNFLCVLLVGILTSILSLAKLIHYCLESYPIMVWSFFFGLVLASSCLLLSKIKERHVAVYACLLLGLLLSLAIIEARPGQLPATLEMAFFAGFIAICAMILPGVSGSFILLLMGMYQVIIQAISQLDVPLLLSFALGCICGLLVFSRILAFLLRHYFSYTLALLTGFLIGSLNLLWPWKHVLSSIVDRHGELIPLKQSNIFPWSFASMTGESANIFPALICAIVGFLAVYLLERGFKTS